MIEVIGTFISLGLAGAVGVFTGRYLREQRKEPAAFSIAAGIAVGGVTLILTMFIAMSAGKYL